MAFRPSEIAGVSSGGHDAGDHQQKGAGADEGPEEDLAAGDDAGPVASANEGFSVLDGHLGEDSGLKEWLGEDVYGGEECVVEFGVGAFDEAGGFEW